MGFEPMEPVKAHFLSREASSTTPANLLKWYGGAGQTRTDKYGGCSSDP